MQRKCAHIASISLSSTPLFSSDPTHACVSLAQESGKRDVSHYRHPPPPFFLFGDSLRFYPYFYLPWKMSTSSNWRRTRHNQRRLSSRSCVCVCVCAHWSDWFALHPPPPPPRLLDNWCEDGNTEKYPSIIDGYPFTKMDAFNRTVRMYFLFALSVLIQHCSCLHSPLVLMPSSFHFDSVHPSWAVYGKIPGEGGGGGVEKVWAFDRDRHHFCQWICFCSQSLYSYTG